MVNHLEVVMQSLYKYFSSSPMRHLELAKLGDIMETKGLKILNNVKTHWISMLSPFKWVLQKYRPLLLKMALDSPTIQAFAFNLECITNFETLLNLVCIVPLLNIVKILIKLVQAQDVFVIDLVQNNQIGPNKITWNVLRSFYYFQI